MYQFELNNIEEACRGPTVTEGTSIAHPVISHKNGSRHSSSVSAMFLICQCQGRQHREMLQAWLFFKNYQVGSHQSPNNKIRADREGKPASKRRAARRPWRKPYHRSTCRQQQRCRTIGAETAQRAVQQAA